LGVWEKLTKLINHYFHFIKIIELKYVQWGDNQNGVFEFVVKEISVLPTLIAFQGLKNWYFTMNFLSQHHIFVNKACRKFQGQKFHLKKDVQNLPTCVVVKKIHYCQI